MISSISKKRVLIAAGSYVDAAAAIRLAERIASGLIAELGGVLIDDEAIAETTGLPVQRVVTSGGMLVQVPSRSRLAGLMQSDARAFRSGLSGVASACTVEWVFEHRRGDLISGICEAARGWDLLLVGHRTGRRRVGRVVLVDHALSPSSEAASLARGIADRLGTDVATIAVNGQSGGADEPDTSPEIVQSEQALLARINRINAALVIVDLAEGPLRGREQLRHLIEASRCPVLVLNASRAEPAIAHSAMIPEPPRRPEMDM
ncbi:hypothetical protein [Aliiruegeria lutimaris]|uniref:Universal stress protein family protein n=1 Tax=Aliiruegeria lutimaris TaxID=571298 RepID=A0A1G8YJW6_9RHOB|nr:hypothetical protein [Aliiruegeria lutimaris]SDK03051.1 hypothetical protein SAMN04488026_102939 [Aliiruegeria lutimaris]